MTPERLKELIARFQDKPEMVAALQRQLDEALKVQYPANAPLDSEAERDRANQGFYDAPKQEAPVAVPVQPQQPTYVPPTSPLPPPPPTVGPTREQFDMLKGDPYSKYIDPYAIPEEVENSSLPTFIPKASANERTWAPETGGYVPPVAPRNRWETQASPSEILNAMGNWNPEAAQSRASTWNDHLSRVFNPRNWHSRSQEIRNRR